MVGLWKVTCEGSTGNGLERGKIGKSSQTVYRNGGASCRPETEKEEPDLWERLTKSTGLVTRM